MLVIDNAHRRDDLPQLLGLLARRAGVGRVLLIARPGFDEHLSQALDAGGFGSVDGPGQLRLEGLTNAEIAELVLQAPPALPFEGAVDQIVALADGNPLIALLAHSVVAQGQPVAALRSTGVLSRFLDDALAAFSRGHPTPPLADVQELLAVMSAFGSLHDDEIDSVSPLVDLAPVRIRRLLRDLADTGLLIQPSRKVHALSPDLLSAEMLRRSHLAPRPTASVTYADLWAVADSDRQEAMCKALGGVTVDGGDDSEAAHLVRKHLRGLAAAHASTALRLAQHIAPALPEVAAEVIDVVLEHDVDPEGQQRERVLLSAAEVLERVPDISAGWPCQLRVAEALWSRPTSEAATRSMRDRLERVYARAPSNTGPDDGAVLAQIQATLQDETRAHWTRRNGQPGCARAVAEACGLLLSVTGQSTSMSVRAERTMLIRSFTLPASEQTRRTLLAGAELLVATLPHLPPAEQLEALRAVERMRVPQLHPSPPGGRGLDDLLSEARDAIGHGLRTASGLALPTRARASELFGGRLWPDDRELQQYRALLTQPVLGRSAFDRQALGARIENRARALLAATDIREELECWERWAAITEQAEPSHTFWTVLDGAIHRALHLRPAAVAAPLRELMKGGGALSRRAPSALSGLLLRRGGRQLGEALGADHRFEVRVAAVRALGPIDRLWALRELERLADDEMPAVREAVMQASVYRPDVTTRRLGCAVRACGPDRVDLLVRSLAILDPRARAPDEQAPALAPRFRELAYRIIDRAAVAERFDDHSLAEIARLLGDPAVALGAVLRRLRWLARAPTGTLTSCDGLRDEVEEAVRAAAGPATAIEALDLLERDEVRGLARDAARDLLAWIDEDAVVDGRLARWIAGRDSARREEALQVLRRTRRWDRFSRRARAMLTVEGADPELDRDIATARVPTWWMGSEAAVHQRLVHEFGAWSTHTHPRVRLAGAHAVVRFAPLATPAAERAGGARNPMGLNA